jgi:hypothetical protein
MTARRVLREVLSMVRFLSRQMPDRHAVEETPAAVRNAPFGVVPFQTETGPVGYRAATTSRV